MGGEAAELTAGRQRVHVPHLVRPAVVDAEDREIHARRREGEDGRGRLGQQRLRQGRPRRLHQGVRPRAASRSSPTSRPNPARPISPPTSCKVKAADPDAIFVYLNEEESARILSELRRQGVTAPLIGETTLIGQKVIELAGDAANGARGHVGLTADAPVAGDPGVPRKVRRAVQLRARPQRHQGLSRASTWSRPRPRRWASSTARRSPRRCTA